MLIKFFEKFEHAKNFKDGNILIRNHKHFRKTEDDRRDKKEGKIIGGNYVYFIKWPKNSISIEQIEREITKLQAEQSQGYIPLIIRTNNNKMYIYGFNSRHELDLQPLNEEKMRNFDEKQSEFSSLPAEIHFAIHETGLIHNSHDGECCHHALITCFTILENIELEKLINESCKQHKTIYGKEFKEQHKFLLKIKNKEILTKVFLIVALVEWATIKFSRDFNSILLQDYSSCNFYIVVDILEAPRKVLLRIHLF